MNRSEQDHFFKQIAIIHQELEQEEQLITHSQKVIGFLKGNGKESFQKGQYDDALEHYQRALVFLEADYPPIALYANNEISLSKEHPSLLTNIAKLQTKLGNFNKAPSGYEKSLKLLATSPLKEIPSLDILRANIKEWLADISTQLGNTQTALCYLEDARDLRETSNYLRGRRQHDPALARQLDEERARLFEKVADKQHKQDQLESAIAGYEQAIELYNVLFANQNVLLNDNLIKLLNKVAPILSILGSKEKATDSYRRALELLYDNAEYYYQQGQLEEASDRYTQIVDLYEQRPVFADNPTSSNLRRKVELLIKITHFAKMLGRPDKAYNSAERALALYSGLTEPSQLENERALLHVNIADNLRETGQLDQAWQHCQEALEIYQAIPSLNPKLELDKQRVQLFIHMGLLFRDKAGIKNQFMKPHPLKKSLLSYDELKLAAKALNYYQQALLLYQLDTSKTELLEAERMFVYVRCANIFHSMGKMEEALKHYEKALELYQQSQLSQNREIDVLAVPLYMDMGYTKHALIPTDAISDHYIKVWEEYYEPAKKYHDEQNHLAEDSLLNKQRIILFMRIAAILDDAQKESMALEYLSDAVNLLTATPYDNDWSNLAVELSQALCKSARVVEKQEMESEELSKLFEQFSLLSQAFVEAMALQTDTTLHHIQMREHFIQCHANYLQYCIEKQQTDQIISVLAALQSDKLHDLIKHELEQSLSDGKNLENKKRCLAFPQQLNQQIAELQIIMGEQVRVCDGLNTAQKLKLHDKLFSSYENQLEEYRQLKTVLRNAGTLSFKTDLLTHIELSEHLRQKTDTAIVFLAHYPNLPNEIQTFALIIRATCEFLITHLTNKNEVVLDPFLGSGLVARKCLDMKLKFIGFDINPLSIELTELYLTPPSPRELRKAISEIYSSLKDEISVLYGLSNGKNASHYFWNQGKLSKVWIKEGRKRIEIAPTERDIKKIVDSKSYESKQTRQPRFFDNSRINAKKSLKLSDLFSPRALRLIDLLWELSSQYDENMNRAIMMILTASVGQMSKMVFAVSKRGKTKGAVTDKIKIEVGSWVIGYWRPAIYFEVNAWNCFENKANKLIKALNDIEDLPPSTLAQSIPQLLFNNDCHSLLQCGDSEKLLQEIPSQSIKLVLTDPPHGDRIPYLELSELWNCILGYQADYQNELVVSNAKERGKTIEKYNQKLAKILSESMRVLVDNGVLAVMFNAKTKDHWDSLHTLDKSKEVVYVGCYPLEYSTGSVFQDNRIGGLKYDYVLIYIKNAHKKVSQEIVNHFCEIPGWLSEYPNKEQ